MKALRTSQRSLQSLKLSHRSIHSSLPKSATPISNTSTPGPPPPAPTPTLPISTERIERKKALAARLAKSRTFTPDAPKTSPLKQRFWKTVTVKTLENGDYQIMLDTRAVRDSAKRVIVVPRSKPYLATALALEWDQLTSALQATKGFYIPLTSLLSRALDIQEADEAASGGVNELRDGLVKVMLRYLSTDTLLCWAPKPGEHEGVQEGEKTLRGEQQRLAMPVIEHLTRTVWPAVDIVPALDETSILPRPQPQETIDVIAGWLTGLPAFELAAVERAVLASKSLLTAVRLVVEWSSELEHLRANGSVDSTFGIEEAHELVTVETRWQTRVWGEVEDTHDVEREDLKRQLGSVILLVNGMKF